MKHKQKKQKQSKQSQVIGNGVFREQFTKNVQNTFVHRDQIEVLSSISWLIIEENADEWEKILFYMQESKAYIIKIANLKEVSKFSFLKNIERIRFVSLKNLTLTNINIENIQFLSFMNAERLTSLNLKQNSITSLKPLQKTVFDFIEKIHIQSNLFFSVDQLNRMKLKSEKLINLTFADTKQQFFVQDISFLVKINKKSCTSLSEFGLVRYCQDKSEKQLKTIGQYAIKRKHIKQVLERRFTSIDYSD